MPISLPPLSRRRFLKRSILAGAAAAAAPQLLANAVAPAQSTWALLADTHIAADPATNARGVNMAANFEAAGKEIAALSEPPTGLFVLGDLAYSSGEPSDYRTFTKLLKPIRSAGIPVHLALGNHDHREHFWTVLGAEKEIKRPVAERQAALVPSQLVNWFVLDSLEQTLSTPGLIGAEQLKWLAESLDANPDKPAVILVHHNPGERESISGLKDTDELFGQLRSRKQVKALCFGHTHHWNATQDTSGIHLINLPPVAYVFRRERPSGWIKALVNAESMTLEVRCLDSSHEAHGQKMELKWRS